METFKFNFSINQNNQFDGDSNDNKIIDVSQTAQNSQTSNEVVEVIAKKSEAAVASKLELVGGIKINKVVVNLDRAAELLQDEDVREKDLIKGKYEGGFKLWEGGIDLSNFLIETWRVKYCEEGQGLVQGGDLKDKKVLELGCGHGVPGIVAALCGAHVHFQDFNRQVLETVTCANVESAIKSYKLASITRYFAGDWELLVDFCAKRGLAASYDVIVSAETIYEVSQYDSLLECIKALLLPPHGVAYICAKSYYFGVGGGVAEFVKFVKKDGVLTTKIVRNIDDQQGNKRQIIKLQFPDILQPYFS